MTALAADRPISRPTPAIVEWMLAGCVLLGLFLRLLAAARWNAGHPDSVLRLHGDEPGYDDMARDIVNGFGITWPGRTPLYPYWLAAMRVLGRGSYDFIVYAQAVAATIVVPLTFLLARRLFGAGVALVAAFLVATNWVLIHQVVLLQTEVLYTPMILLVALALQEALSVDPVSREGAKRFLFLGALIGASDLLRPTLALFPAFVVLAVLVRTRARRAIANALLCAAGAALVVAPWAVHNWYRYHVFLPLSTNNAVLWLGSPEYYHLTHDAGYSYMDVWRKVIFDQHDAMPDPGGIEGNRAWNTRARRSILAEPLVYARFSAEKAVTFWVGDPLADWDGTFIMNPGVFREWGASWSVTFQNLVARALIFPALLALVVLRRRWRELLPITSLLLYCTLLHAATAAVARLSDPLQPLLWIVIVGALAQLAERWRAGGRHPARAAY
jgi:4-amino-4-deoxy-L-arabinose transferase-like glycosyltransferase